MCKICSSNIAQISPWNRWNDRLSQSLWSFENATSICAVVRKGILLGAAKRKVQVETKWHEATFCEMKDESEIAVVGTPHGIVFARSIRRGPKDDSGDGMLFNSIRGAPWELQPRVEREVVNRVQLDVRAAIPESQAPPQNSRGTVAKTSLHQAISGIGEVRVHGQVYRVPACEIEIEAAVSQRGVPCQDCQAHDR